VRFEVTDTGIGISPADAERLFEPFTQADASTTRTYGGTGLGLAISRQLTEAMGGTIGVTSTPGDGSTFWCEIPFEPPRGDAETTAPDAAGLRTLVVGAGPDRAALEADLRRWDLGVTTADTAAAALQLLRDAARHGRPFDVLLLDAQPGDVDTAGLARTVAADPAIPAVQVVVLNTSGGHEDTAIHLPTPVHRSDLYDLLAQSMAAVVPVPTTTPPAPATAPAGRGTVLLVEDNDINQMVAVGVLTSLGYRADVAGDGVQACEMAAARTYDAILMDCRMPRMDGFTATARLREREQRDGTRTPVIAMTASALVADRERCLAAGMDDYLAKPVNPAELAHALERWVHGEATPPAPAAPPVASGHDPIGHRLDELAGDRSGPELDLVHRLVTSFLDRAPRLLTAVQEAFEQGDRQAFEDQAHSLKGAAGNIGADAVAAVCARLEDRARAGELPAGTAAELDVLREELRWAERRLRLVLDPAADPGSRVAPPASPLSAGRPR
jgi:CheY-like chemotaxis protein/HPt (histidine-containing phosphotransfer) domain-containing protein